MPRLDLCETSKIELGVSVFGTHHLYLDILRHKIKRTNQKKEEKRKAKDGKQGMSSAVTPTFTPKPLLGMRAGTHTHTQREKEREREQDGESRAVTTVSVGDG